MDAVGSRDAALEFLAAAAIAMVNLSRLAEELVLWSTAEFGFIELSDAYSTGSSLMPQKKNPDVPELVRGKTGRVIGDLVALLTVVKGLPLTYNRDLQEDKEPLFDAAATLRDSLAVMAGAIATLAVRRDAMRAAAEDPMLLATDLAEALVRAAASRSARRTRRSERVVAHCVAGCRRFANAHARRVARLPPAFRGSRRQAARARSRARRALDGGRDGPGARRRRRSTKPIARWPPSPTRSPAKRRSRREPLDARRPGLGTRCSPPAPAGGTVPRSERSLPAPRRREACRPDRRSSRRRPISPPGRQQSRPSKTSRRIHDPTPRVHQDARRRQRPVVLDGLRDALPDDLGALSRRLADRRFGIGARPGPGRCAPRAVADLRMEIYDADGSQVEMCGNGIRAVFKYLRDRRSPTRTRSRSRRWAATVHPRWAGDDRVAVQMGRPIFAAEKIPTRIGQGDGPLVDVPLEVDGQRVLVTSLSMGNPHAVLFVADVDAAPVTTLGPRIENHPAFPNRVNVEFVQVLGRDRVRQRTWERGTGETLACGSGACAVGVACMLRGATERAITVELRGGELRSRGPQTTRAC